ncbi:carbohydrate kinase [Halorubraceae archaeon YAN]|nr:carbohydrate kinase [Halorubraceae archaeon YAN]
MHQILVAGETLIDFLPDSAGSLSTVESFSRRPGGAPANVAVGLARLGTVPMFWTRVGDDKFGDFLVDTLTAEGLSTAHIERDSAAKTGLAFVSLGTDAEREFSFYRHESADTQMTADTVDDALLAGRSWVHVGGVTLADEPSRSATQALATAAKKHGIPVSFDPNARPELWTTFDFGESIRDILSVVDVLKVTTDDLDAAGFDTNVAPDAIVRSLLNRDEGPHTVCLTRGADGVTAGSTPEAPWNNSDSTRSISHSGFSVDPVDTTGAGDAFTAGLISALATESSLNTALERGNAVAALTTTSPGAMTALPTQSELAAFMNAQ